MHPQLQALLDDFGSARERLHRLQATVPADKWAQRPSEGSWSVAECVAHLNLTSRAYIAPPAAEFDRLQDEQMELVRQADGLPLGKLKIVSPFGPGFKYNLYSAFTILPAHQHRHLQQAERAWETLSNG
jgi:hypothetical protein